MADVHYRRNLAGEHELGTSRSSPLVRHMVRVQQAVIGVADRLTPVDTGHLRRNNDSKLITGSEKITVRVFNPVYYAGYVHNGTRYMRGRPWLVEAVRLVTGKTPH